MSGLRVKVDRNFEINLNKTKSAPIYEWRKVESDYAVIFASYGNEVVVTIHVMSLQSMEISWTIVVSASLYILTAGGRVQSTMNDKTARKRLKNAINDALDQLLY